MTSPGHTKKRENWADVETQALTDIIKESKHFKNGRFKPEIDSTTAFEELASLLNSKRTGPKRTGEQIKSKWYNELRDIHVLESSTETGSEPSSPSASGGEPSSNLPTEQFSSPDRNLPNLARSPAPADLSGSSVEQEMTMEDLSRQKIKLEIELLSLKIEKLKKSE